MLAPPTAGPWHALGGDGQGSPGERGGSISVSSASVELKLFFWSGFTHLFVHTSCTGLSTHPLWPPWPGLFPRVPTALLTSRGELRASSPVHPAPIWSCPISAPCMSSLLTSRCIGQGRGDPGPHLWSA